ncbi:MAG TPA: 6,7-dimethyl-8-ribityllumazine synthase [Pseudolabrys sp.]
MAKKKTAAAKGKAGAKTTSKKGAPLKFLIVEARYYENIAAALLLGAGRVLDAAGATYDVITVPGALEIPAAIAMAFDAKGASYDGAVALGCVIQGQTYHFDIVCNESARGLMDLSLRGVPLGNGILTVDNEAQAFVRSSEERNKGGEAARAALAMAALKRKLS